MKCPDKEFSLRDRLAPATLFRAFLGTTEQRSRSDLCAGACGFSTTAEIVRHTKLVERDEPSAWIQAMGEMSAGCVRLAAIGLRRHEDDVVGPLVDVRLATLKQLSPARRANVAEHLIEDLRWRDDRSRLVALLDHPLPVASSRAAVALGCMGAVGSSTRIAELHDRLWRKGASQKHGIGTLWALHDLGATDALRSRLVGAQHLAMVHVEISALWAARGEVCDVEFLVNTGAGEEPDLNVLFALYAIARRVGFQAFHAAVPNPQDAYALTDFFGKLDPDAAKTWFSPSYHTVHRGGATRSWWPGRSESRGLVAHVGTRVNLW